MPQTATIKSLPAAFRMMKAMQAEDVEWGEDYRGAARQVLTELLESRMAETIDRHLERIAERGQADRRNGCYRRGLLTELGAIELSVPRTRTFSALRVVRAYARRVRDVDRMILACFVLGLSTRKVARALLPILGRPVSPGTVSQVAKQLDAAVAAFHQRPGRAGALDREEALLRAHRPAPRQLGQTPGAVPLLLPVALQASQRTVVGTQICACLPVNASSSVISRL